MLFIHIFVCFRCIRVYGFIGSILVEKGTLAPPPSVPEGGGAGWVRTPPSEHFYHKGWVVRGGTPYSPALRRRSEPSLNGGKEAGRRGETGEGWRGTRGPGLLKGLSGRSHGASRKGFSIPRTFKCARRTSVGSEPEEISAPPTRRTLMSSCPCVRGAHYDTQEVVFAKKYQ